MLIFFLVFFLVRVPFNFQFFLVNLFPIHFCFYIRKTFRHLAVDQLAQGALNEARSSQYADRFFYALGSAGGGGSASAALQQLGTANVASVVGVSACFPRCFFFVFFALCFFFFHFTATSSMKRGLFLIFFLPARSFMADVKRGVASDVGYASVGVWTVDSASAVRRYVAAGADLILTNRPGVAAAAVGGAGALAAPGLALVAKTGAGRQTSN